MSTETTGRTGEQHRNARLAANIAAGTAVPDLPDVIATVRQMAAANLDVPGPRAAQIADALDRANEWQDCATAAWWAWHDLDRATTITAQGQAAIELSNRMSDLASWLPGYDAELGRLRYEEEES